MKNFLFVILFVNLLTTVGVYAQTNIQSVTSGSFNWSQTTAWQGGIVPGRTHHAEIRANTTVLLTNDVVINNLVIRSGATLFLPVNSNRILTIEGNLTIESGGVLSITSSGSVSSSVHHQLIVKGNIINNGTLDCDVSVGGFNHRTTLFLKGKGSQSFDVDGASEDYFNVVIDKDDSVTNNQVIITAPSSFTFNVNQFRVTSGATFLFESNANEYTLVVDSNLLIEQGGAISTQVTTNTKDLEHEIIIYGNFINNGTYDAYAVRRATYAILTTFMGTASQQFTLGVLSVTNFYEVTIDKNNNTANNTLTFTPAGIITFEGGSIANARFFNFTNAKSNFVLTGNATFVSHFINQNSFDNINFTLNAPNAIIGGFSGDFDLRNQTTVNINAGVFLVGTANGHNLVLNASNTRLNINGGTLSIASNQTFDRGLTTLSSGEIIVGRVAINSGNSSFQIASSNFVATGGVVSIANPNQGSGNDVDLSATEAATFSNQSSIKIGYGLTTSGLTFKVADNIYKLTFEPGKNLTAKLSGTLTINSSIDLAEGKLQLNNNRLIVAGSLFNVTQNPIISTASSSLEFTGSSNVEFALSQTSNNITNQLNTLIVRTSNNAIVTMRSNVKVSGTFSLTSGDLAIDSDTLTLRDAVNITTSNANAIRGSANAIVQFTISANRTIHFDQSVDSVTNFLKQLLINNTNSAVITIGNKLVLAELRILSGSVNISGQSLVIAELNGNARANVITNSSTNLSIVGNNTLDIPSTITTTNIITVNRPGGTVSINANISATRVNLIAGTLNGNGRTITFNQWENNGGQYTAGLGGRVITTGSSSIAGAVVTQFNRIDIGSTSTLNITSNVVADSIIIPASNSSISITLNSGDTLRVNRSFIINQPTSNSRTALFQVTGGVAYLRGQLQLSGTSTGTSRVTQITVNTGEVHIPANLVVSGTTPANKNFNLVNGNGRLVIYGNPTLTNASFTSGINSSIVFGDSNVLQQFNKFGSGTYSNIVFANRSVSGVRLAANLSSADFTGNLIVEAGKFHDVGFAISASNGKTFNIKANAEYVHTSTTYPNFSTYLFETGSMFNYAHIAAINIRQADYDGLALSGGSVKSMVSDITVKGLLRLDSGYLSIGSNTLTLSGGFIGNVNNNLRANGNSNLRLNGTGNIGALFIDQTIEGVTNTFSSVTLNRNGGVITLANRLRINDVITPTAGTLNSNGHLVLTSTQNKTARVASGNGNDIIGNVTVERYIPAVTRRYRFFSSPVKNFTFNQLVDDIFISGPGGAANGFDPSTANGQTIFTYQESTTGGRGWKGLTNVNNGLAAGRGAIVFIRGDRSIGTPNWFTAPFPAQNAVTLDAFGELNSGDINVALSYTNTGNSLADGWNLVGNPYPSPIDWNSLTKTNIAPFYYILNPLTGSYEVQSASSAPIASGQAFFVKAIASNAAIGFTESSKVGTTPNTFFKTNAIEQLEVVMQLDSLNADKAMLQFVKTAGTGFNQLEDAPKYYNSIINLSFLTSDAQEVQLSAVPNTLLTDTFSLVTSTGVGGSYTLHFNLQQLPSSTGIYLLDAYINGNFDLRQQNYYTFNVMLNDTLTFRNRFKVVFVTNAVLPVKWGNVEAKQKNDKVEVLWNTVTEVNNSRFEVERSIDGLNFKTIGKVLGSGNSNVYNRYQFYDEEIDLSGLQTIFYRIKQIDYDGKFSYSKVVTVHNDNIKTAEEFLLFPNPASTNTTIQTTSPIVEIKLTDVSGKEINVNHEIGVNQLSIAVKDLARGVYYVQVKTLAFTVVKTLIIE